MARSSRFNDNQLAWTQNWYVRDDTVDAAGNAIINYQRTRPMAQCWGPGMLTWATFPVEASARQNALTQAIREYGRVVNTISLLRYLPDAVHRRRILVQLDAVVCWNIRRMGPFRRCSRRSARRRRPRDRTE